MRSLEEIFSGSEGTEPEAETETATTEQETAQPEQETAQETGVEVSQVAAETEAAAEPSEVAGLKAAAAAERKKRQEIEAERESYRQELEQARQLLAQQQAAQEEEKPFLGEEYEQRFTQTDQKTAQALFNQKWDISEAITREAHEDYDDKVEVFKEMMKGDPGLYNRMIQQPLPAKWLYKQASEYQQMQKFREIGDPAKYEAELTERIREQERAKILAELAAEKKATTEAAIRAKLPRTGFAEERSSGTARATVKTFTGPTPLKDLFKR
jgi:hypothetical protein